MQLLVFGKKKIKKCRRKTVNIIYLNLIKSGVDNIIIIIVAFSKGKINFFYNSGQR